MRELLTTLFLLLSATAAVAQDLPWNVPFTPGGVNTEQARARAGLNEQLERLRQTKFMDALGPSLPTMSESAYYAQSIYLEARKRFQPEKSLIKTYAPALGLPNTGMTLLTPRKYCGAGGEVGVTKKLLKTCPTMFIAGGGSYFSFRDRDYATPDLADVGIFDKYFVAFGNFNQSIMVNIGDVPIDEIGPETKGLPYLWKFSPSKTPAQADAELKKFGEGVVVDGLTYANFLPIEVGRTYLVRVVAYRVPLPNGRYSTPNRRDVIAGFRVVRRDPDGTLTLLWRKLSDNPSPQLEIPFTPRSLAE